MIVVTGGAGFIGSAFVWRLNEAGIDDILIVDHQGKDAEWGNLETRKYNGFIDKDEFLTRIEKDDFGKDVEAIFHLGACSSTTETDAVYLIENNYEYSKRLALYCLKEDAYYCYASSAATYGDGSHGYSDREEKLDDLKPLNMYGFSKHLFDCWMYRTGYLEKAVGLKYFNVFGPNEYHKGDMKSLVCKGYEQVLNEGKIRLFKSYHPDFGDGEQKRDFIYVKDVVEVMYRLFSEKKHFGLFNLGTGEAKTWIDLATPIFSALGKEVLIEFIDMPESIKDKYQYFTQSDMSKLFEQGFDYKFTPLEEAVTDYVTNYLHNGYAKL